MFLYNKQFFIQYGRYELLKYSNAFFIVYVDLALKYDMTSGVHMETDTKLTECRTN